MSKWHPCQQSTHHLRVCSNVAAQTSWHCCFSDVSVPVTMLLSVLAVLSLLLLRYITLYGVNVIGLCCRLGLIYRESSVIEQLRLMHSV